MPKHYFHLRDGTDELLDHEGIELPDQQAVERHVLNCARDVMSNELRSDGLVDLRYRIDAELPGGEIVYSLAFTDAVEIRR